MPVTAMRRIVLALVLVQVSWSPTPTHRESAPARQVAITFDDLPVVSRLYTENADQDRITRRLIAAVRAHRVPAIGFVNEGKLHRSGRVDSAQAVLLRLWVAAGFELGNHSYSHFDLHTTPFSEFVRDVVRGDSVTRQVLAEAGRTRGWALTRGLGGAVFAGEPEVPASIMAASQPAPR